MVVARLRRLLARAVGGRGGRGAAMILGGTAAGQALVVLASPILSRLYAPEAFGLLATFTAIVGFGAIVSALRLEMAVPTAPDVESARRIVRGGLGLAVWFTVLGTLVAFVARGWVARTVNVPALETWLPLAPLACGFAAAFVVLNQWAVREGHFASIGRRGLWRSIATVGGQLGAGAAGLRPGGTVLGLTLGHAVGTATMMSGAHGFRLRDVVRGMREAGQVVRERLGFCVRLTASGLFNVAGSQGPLLVVAYAFTAREIGHLGFTQRILAVPIALLGTAIAQVYVSALAKRVRTGGELARLYRRVSSRLIAVALVGAAVLLFAGPVLFRTVFGGPWETSGQYARYLSLGMAAQFVSVPLSQTLILVGRTAEQLLWDIGRFVVVVGAVVVAIRMDATADRTVLVLGTAMFVCYTVQWVMNYRVVRNR